MTVMALVRACMRVSISFASILVTEHILLDKDQGQCARGFTLQNTLQRVPILPIEMLHLHFAQFPPPPIPPQFASRRAHPLSRTWAFLTDVEISLLVPDFATSVPL